MKRAFALCALLLLPSCVWLEVRGRDFVDIVDLKWGVPVWGLGAKVEATNWLGAGIGGAKRDHAVHVREWYGRKCDGSTEMWFGHLPWIGFDGEVNLVNIFDLPQDAFARSELNVFGIQFHSMQNIWAEGFRFGGELVLPGIAAGAYFNLGERFDFLIGWVGLDPSGDDNE